MANWKQRVCGCCIPRTSKLVFLPVAEPSKKRRGETRDLINSGIISAAINKLSASRRKYAAAFIYFPIVRKWAELNGETILSNSTERNSFALVTRINAQKYKWTTSIGFSVRSNKLWENLSCNILVRWRSIDLLLHYLFVRVTDRIRTFSRLSLTERQFFRFSVGINFETSAFDAKNIGYERKEEW